MTKESKERGAAQIISISNLPDRCPFSTRNFTPNSPHPEIYFTRSEVAQIVDRLRQPIVSESDAVYSVTLVHGWYRTGQTSAANMAADRFIRETNAERFIDAHPTALFWQKYNLGEPFYVVLSTHDLKSKSDLFTQEGILHRIQERASKIASYAQVKEKSIINPAPVIVFDELQYLDDPTPQLQVFTDLARSGTVFFLIGVYSGPIRSDHSQNLRSFFGEPVTLQLLSDDDIARYYDQVAPWLPQELRDWLIKEAGGHLALAQVLGHCVYDCLSELLLIEGKKKASFASLIQMVEEIFAGTYISPQSVFMTQLSVQREIRQGGKIDPFILDAMPRQSAQVFYRSVNDYLEMYRLI